MPEYLQWQVQADMMTMVYRTIAQVMAYFVNVSRTRGYTIIIQADSDSTVTNNWQAYAHQNAEQNAGYAQSAPNAGTAQNWPGYAHPNAGHSPFLAYTLSPLVNDDPRPTVTFSLYYSFS